MYKDRENERYQLLNALDSAGVWPTDNPRQGNCLYGEGYPNGIMEAVERFVSSSNCSVFLVQPEDIFGAVKLQNLPGSDRDKHPNWRRKVSVNIEDYAKNENFMRAVRSINR
jgi:(1->4)-alpha-D-glucan 1-alpha-D-glucosylmutase